jgi:hypothetical protein
MTNENKQQSEDEKSAVPEKTPAQNKNFRDEQLRQRLEQIANFDFASLGFSPEEQGSLIKFESKIFEVFEKCQDDQQEFLHILKGSGIRIVPNSKYLKAQRGLTYGGLQQTAGFAPREVVQKQIESLGHGLLKEELEQVADAPGVIFLGRHPLPKSIWHEGLHALQMLNNFSMTAADPKIQAQRELEVNYLLIRLKQQGFLKDVSMAKYEVTGKTVFGEAVKLDPNDIGQEVIYAENNIKKLREINKTAGEIGDKAEMEKIKQKINKF